MAKKKAPKKKQASSSGKKKISKDQLLWEIVQATEEGDAIYEFFPGSKKMDFIHLYCDGLIRPGGTHKQGWVATKKGKDIYR